MYNDSMKERTLIIRSMKNVSFCLKESWRGDKWQTLLLERVVTYKKA